MATYDHKRALVTRNSAISAAKHLEQMACHV